MDTSQHTEERESERYSMNKILKETQYIRRRRRRKKLHLSAYAYVFVVCDPM
jgi:hypothetical protein